MALKPANALLKQKIVFGIRKAVAQLVQRRAAENSTLVVLVNEKPVEVSAKDLLKKLKNH